MGAEMNAQATTPATMAYPVRASKPVGKWIAPIYKSRISQFYSEGQWEKVNLLSMMHDAVAANYPHVILSVWHAPDLSRPTFAEVMKHKDNFSPTKIGTSFGPSWSTHWFRVELTVPSYMCHMEHLELHWDASNEGLVWSDDGRPLQGLTGGGERVEWILPQDFRDGAAHCIYVEMACNGMFGNGANGDIIQPPEPDRFFRLVKAEIVAVNLDARQLRIDMWIIGDAAREFPSDSWEQHEALRVCNDIANAFVHGDKDSLKRCRKMAEQYIGPRVNSSAVYDSSDRPPLVYGIGHCHIDTCWLWPWAETRRKVARSWANQCDLMDRYPEARFACSQAQQYKWLKEDYPNLFDRVKLKVKQGRFQPVGGSWVEHDTNMPSGESLVRQFLYGQRFFDTHFGRRSQTFWLPDTFGYAAQLPQICRLAGMTRFMTQKLSWNNINNFPHTTFNWVALDGSQVICHMPPSETYTANAHFGDVKRSIERHKSLDQDSTSLLVFGKGDGGGGPTWEHFEKLRRCRGISDTVGLLPRVHLGASVDDFFDRLEPKADTLVTWYGELYFELHRGTYTTQADNKRNNRKAEAMLRDIELLATIASIEAPNTFSYPAADLDDMWEAVLLCQFHDCLPGSSIEMCYDDSDKLYAKVFQTGQRLLSKIYQALGVKEPTGRRDEPLMALNTLPWKRHMMLPQPGTAADTLIAGPQLGLLGRAEREPAAGQPAVTAREIEPGCFELENSRLRVRIVDGCITSLYDRRAAREVISPGAKANQYVIFDDKPLYWQAWDVEVYHLDSRRELASTRTRLGPCGTQSASVVTETRISDKSHATTTYTLSAVLSDDDADASLSSSSYVEVTCDVDWHETMKFLKVEFPVDIVNTEASYETAFGLVKRPTHYNTSWDMAKFEVCCHRWADLSEHGYGVSILNDSKYGFATCGSLMRLSLLRAPKAPDAHADMGQHCIRWAILPHQGALGPETVRRAIEFNTEPRVVVSAALPPTSPKSLLPRPHPVNLHGSPSLILDTIKRGADDYNVSRRYLPPRSGRSVVLRVYDSLGGRGRATISVSWKVRQVQKTNVLEDEGEPVPVVEGHRFDIELRPFEVATYRVFLED